MTTGKEAVRQAFIGAVDETLDAWLESRGGAVKIKGAGETAFPLFVEKLQQIQETETDMRLSTDGCGVWLRQIDDFTPEAFIRNFDFGVLAINKGTRQVNRSGAWQAFAKRVIAGGRPLWAMDWGPSPDGWTPRGIDEMCRYAKGQGFAGVMVDAEPDFGWHASAAAAAETYAATLRTACDKHGLESGYTNYGRHSDSEALFSIFLHWLEVGFPQSYDPAGAYAADYHQKTYNFWKTRGAKRVVMGLGLWLRSAQRCRTPEELMRHLENIPKEVRGVCGWYASTSSCLDPRLYEVLRAYTPPGLEGEGLRAFIEALTPFGRFL